MWRRSRPLARVRSSAVAGLEQLTPLVLVQATPDAVGLAEVHGVVEALALHGALAADRLGPRLADVAVLASFRVGRREEQGRLRTPACRTRPPRVECVDGHGLSSPNDRASRGAEPTRIAPDLTRGQTSPCASGPAPGSPRLHPRGARPRGPTPRPTPPSPVDRPGSGSPGWCGPASARRG